MNVFVTNNWITLNQQRKGVDIQRKFAGIDAAVNENNSIDHCRIWYWERELYPNGDVIKSERKSYELQDLPYMEVDVNGTLMYMSELLTLTGFVTSLGQPFIINHTNQTLQDLTSLPLTAESGYILHKNTRTLTPVNTTS